MTGLLENANPGTLFIDSSTIDPLASKALGESIELFKSHMVDAPVSGGVIGAEAGTLTFMVGGNDVSYTMAKPILELMGKNIVHCGHSCTLGSITLFYELIWRSYGSSGKIVQQPCACD